MLDEISAEIDRLLKQPLTYQTINTLASLYIVRDHLTADENSTEFEKMCSGKPIAAVMAVMDELMEAVRLTNSRLYECAQRKLTAI